MKKSRKDISFIEDIVEEVFGECSKENLEMANSVFSYIVSEIKTKDESLGYRFPYMGWLTQNYTLLSNQVNEKSNVSDIEYLKHRKALISQISDFMGGTSPNRRHPLVFRQLNRLRKKYHLPEERGKIHPLHFSALEDLQNTNYKKNKS